MYIFAAEHNQDSVYDAFTGDCWYNPFYNETTNPIEGGVIGASHEARWER